MNKTGWICPNCGRGMAPFTPWCCIPQVITTSTTSWPDCEKENIKEEELEVN